MMILPCRKCVSNVRDMLADSRSILTASIRDILEGSEAADPVTAIPDPRALRNEERSAWLQLRNWIEDKELREAHPQHASFSKRRLEQLLLQLD